jgi:predicted nuclease of restriction endonuclease-like RecB superfamily
VLLRASKVRATVHAPDAATLRALFRTLKFLRLLPVITAGTDGAHHIELDGPLSLFQGGTRYGLQLGLALPALAACGRWSIDADVAWGADRRPLRFRLAGVASDAGVIPPSLPDGIATLVAAFDKLASGWRVDLEPAVLDLPGAGLCVPDLAFVRDADGARVFFELLGFWSREAVWRRVELVRAGLPHRILFAASRALRVSESVLEDATSAALYVFARVPSAKQVLAHVERLAAS